MKLKQVPSDWYRKAWTLDMKQDSWVEGTRRKIDFLIDTMALKGTERILDLACDFGRHSLALAEEGFDMVGVDITPDYIADARNTAERRGLKPDFICADIREINFTHEFDVVLNLADGAIGYLENDEENLKIFDKIAAALKPGGKHFMDICNREHAEGFSPKRHWEVGKKSLALADFAWNATTRRMLFAGGSIPFGEPARPPAFLEPGSSIRLYHKAEITNILVHRNMKIISTYSGYNGAPDTPRQLQLMVYSQKLLP